MLRQQTGAHKVRTRTSIGSRVSTENKNRELRTRYVDAKKS